MLTIQGIIREKYPYMTYLIAELIDKRYFHPTDDFIDPADPLHVLHDEPEHQCETCHHAIIDPGSYGGYYEPPTPASVEDCRARKYFGGSMPDEKWEDGIPNKLCPWYAQKYMPETLRKVIRCERCNSPFAKVVKTLPVINDPDFEVQKDLIKCVDCGSTKTIDRDFFWYNSLEKKGERYYGEGW